MLFNTNYQILRIEGVTSHNSLHVWQLKSGTNIASIHIEVTSDANEQMVRHRVTQILRQHGATQSTVQVERADGMGHGTNKRQIADRNQPRNGTVLHIGS
jgi:Co/Zn/Cd efflux system component